MNRIKMNSQGARISIFHPDSIRLSVGRKLVEKKSLNEGYNSSKKTHRKNSSKTGLEGSGGPGAKPLVRDCK